MTKTERKKEKAEAFPEETYQNVTIDDMVLYAIFSLEKKGIEGRFENIVAEAFELFPTKFSLHGYPEYPDARRVFNAIMRMSGVLPMGEESLVSGSMKDVFRVTEKGLERVKEISYILKISETSEIDRKLIDKRGKIGRVLYAVETHQLYKEYLKYGNNVSISESEIRDLLFSTMETPYEKLREKMKILIEYCEIMGRQDIKEFLILCKSKYKNIFETSSE